MPLTTSPGMVALTFIFYFFNFILVFNLAILGLSCEFKKSVPMTFLMLEILKKAKSIVLPDLTMSHILGVINASVIFRALVE